MSDDDQGVVFVAEPMSPGSQSQADELPEEAETRSADLRPDTCTPSPMEHLPMTCDYDQEMDGLERLSSGHLSPPRGFNSLRRKSKSEELPMPDVSQ